MVDKLVRNNQNIVYRTNSQPGISGAQFRIRDNRPGAIAQRKMIQVIQRKEVSTNFGVFKTTKFKRSGIGLDVKIEFQPDPAKMTCSKIGMAQSILCLDGGEPYAIDLRTKDRLVTQGLEPGDGKGYQIDRLGQYNNPVYGADSVGGLAETAEAGRKYHLGKCLPTGEVVNAWMTDKPCGGRKKMFETTALSLDRDGSYYGSVKWGYGFDETNKFKIYNISFVTSGNPSPNFIEPAKLWNLSKSRRKLKATRSNSHMKIGDVLSFVAKESGANIKVQSIDGKEFTVACSCVEVDQDSGVDNIPLPIPETVTRT